MEETVSISVVIPTCNRPELLQESVECVLVQTRAPQEIIVVNNGDDPLALDLGGGAEIRVVDIMPRAGAAQARNFGAWLASGTYVAFLDDDDLWEPRYIEKLHALITSPEVDYVITRLDRLESGTISPYRAILDPATLLERVWVTNPGVGGPNSVVRRAAFMRLGGYDPQLLTSEDRALIAEFLLAGCRVVAAPDIQAIAREHAGDRLTHPARMAEGKRRFLRKYASVMPPTARFRNLAVIHYLEFRSTRMPWHLLQVGVFGSLSWLLGRLDRGYAS